MFLNTSEPIDSKAVWLQRGMEHIALRLHFRPYWNHGILVFYRVFDINIIGIK